LYQAEVAMAKPDVLNTSLLPLVLIAGVLSGTLWRSAGPPGSPRPGQSPGSGDKADVATPGAPWVFELRPAMDSIAAALGLEGGDAYAPPIPRGEVLRLLGNPTVRNQSVLTEMRKLRSTFDDSVGPEGAFCAGASPEAVHAAETVTGALLVEDRDDTKARTAIAKDLLEEFRDWRMLASLAQMVQRSEPATAPVHYDVDFIVATIPDYVDSNSGWLADQSLAAIQSGMTRAGYLFDRVKLIDWSRSAADPSAAVSNSRLHERQPGVLIFRRVEEKTVHLRLVLLVLETPTAGIHQTALRNSLSFIREWNTCTSSPARPLRVLGPTFSGSIVSLATVLADPGIKKAFTARLVVTGSANADENVQKMEDLSDGAIYRATIQPTSVIKERMAAFLGSMNSAWATGKHVALLTESNTAYGTSRASNPESVPFNKHVAEFRFPLHVAQLRNEAPASSQPASLLPAAIIPLNMREASPPADVIPALRPQLTSAVVEATVDSILDAIRHEKYSAVGIVATDDRDVLFLAREVKRTSPDVQLFLFGAHSLYLHPDYVPYLRGTLVASSYSLSLANQPEVGLPDRTIREPFQSMSAEGIFHAARALVSLNQEMKDLHSFKPTDFPYCGSATETGCVPIAPVSISVIGEDGYWPLPTSRVMTVLKASPGSSTPESRAAAAPGAPLLANEYPLPPLPARTLMAVVLIEVAVLAHLLVLFLIRRDLLSDSAAHPFLELPFVRVLAPAQTLKQIAAYHRFALRTCFMFLALLGAWVLAIVLPFWLPESTPSLVTAALSALIFAAVLAAGIVWCGPSRALAQPVSMPTATDAAAPADHAPSHRTGQFIICSCTGWLLFGGIVATVVLFTVVTILLVRDVTAGLESAKVLGRMVGGGIVSPTSLVVCLVAGIYTCLLTVIRRLSLVGYGYKELSSDSRTFAQLTGEPIAKAPGKVQSPQLAMVLDMPAQNMRTIYPLVLLLALALACIGVSHVTTIDGRAFSWFVRIGSLTTLGFGLWVLAQGLATWNTARSHLRRLARSPLEPHFRDIAQHVTWDISLAPPRLTEMMPVARLADRIKRDFRTIGLAGPFGPDGPELRRKLIDFQPLFKTSEQRVALRTGDLAELKALFGPPSHVETLHLEMSVRQHAALIQSTSWLSLWRLSDTIVMLLENTYWARAKHEDVRADVPAVVEGEAGTQWLAWKRGARAAVAGARGRGAVAGAEHANPSDANAAKPPYGDAQMPDSSQRDHWFAECAQLVALQIAFVLRDIVARTITCLFAAMLCLTLLTASHLLYSFNGRASMLTIDLLAVAAVALSAVWILVDMERDHVLSRLRTTTPGRVDLNWDFIRRIAVYGVLPLLAVLASLFPEIGGALFGWLEPIRKLSNF